MFRRLLKRNLVVFKKRPNFVSARNVCFDTRSRDNSTSTRLLSSLSYPKEKLDTLDDKEPKSETQEMLKYFPTVLEDFIEDHTIIRVPEIRKRFRRLLEYIRTIGRYQSAMSLNIVYKMLEKPENLTVENIKRTNMVAWCIFMVQNDIQIMDDLVDHTTTRRQLPSWHTMEDVGLNIVNDSYMLQGGIYYLLRKYISSLPHYADILEIFMEHSFISGIGQSLDCSANFNKISMERFNTARDHKTSYTAFLFPFTIALYLSNKCNLDQYQHIGPILKDMAKYPQMKNDYTDMFPLTSFDVSGGTDASEGKCTWMSATALEMANPAQREIMKTHYGKPSRESIEIIRKLYNELDLHTALAKGKVECFRDLHTRIEKLPKDYPRDALFTILDLSHNDQVI